MQIGAKALPLAWAGPRSALGTHPRSAEPVSTHPLGVSSAAKFRTLTLSLVGPALQLQEHGSPPSPLGAQGLLVLSFEALSSRSPIRLRNLTYCLLIWSPGWRCLGASLWVWALSLGGVSVRSRKNSSPTPLH